MYYVGCIIHPVMKISYEEKLLSDWEDIYRQGLLTFWIFIAIQDKELDVAQVKQRVEQLTHDSYSAAEQSLYRVLRKHYELETVNMREVPTGNGPNRKLYSLSKLGKRLLQRFTQRNITLFNQPDVNILIKKGIKQ